jgi:hypothetical protein
MMIMDNTIHTTVLPHAEPAASPALSRDVLGFEGRDPAGNLVRLQELR